MAKLHNNKKEASKQAANSLEASSLFSPKAKSRLTGALELVEPKLSRQLQYGTSPASVKKADLFFPPKGGKMADDQPLDEGLPPRRGDASQPTDFPWLPPIGVTAEYDWYSKPWHAYYHVYGPPEYDPED